MLTLADTDRSDEDVTSPPPLHSKQEQNGLSAESRKMSSKVTSSEEEGRGGGYVLPAVIASHRPDLVERELEALAQYREELSHHLSGMDDYLRRESRRAQITYRALTPSPASFSIPLSPTPSIRETGRAQSSSSDPSRPAGRGETSHANIYGPHPPSSARSLARSPAPSPPHAENDTSVALVLHNVRQMTQTTVVQFDRCREVIEKLHRDCNDVAARNSTMMSRLRECNDLVRRSVGESTTGTGQSTIGPGESARAPGESARAPGESALAPGENPPPSMSMSLVPMESARSISDEADLLMTSIRSGLRNLEHVLHRVEDDNDATRIVLQGVLQDVRARTRLLGRMTDPPPSDAPSYLTSNHTSRHPSQATSQPTSHPPSHLPSSEPRSHHIRSSTFLTAQSEPQQQQMTLWHGRQAHDSLQRPVYEVRATAEQLAREIFVYMDQERQLSLRAIERNTNANANSKTGIHVRHRDFDEVDKDLYFLKRELTKTSDPRNARILANHVVESTRAERAECLKLVHDIEAVIRERRQELRNQDSQQGKLKKPKKPTTQKRTRANKTPRVQSNFAKKLSQLERELRAYMHLDQDEESRHRSELSHVRATYDSVTRSQAQKIFELEKRVEKTEQQKEKYRELYTKAHETPGNGPLTKPVRVVRPVKRHSGAPSYTLRPLKHTPKMGPQLSNQQKMSQTAPNPPKKSQHSPNPPKMSQHSSNLSRHPAPRVGHLTHRPGERGAGGRRKEARVRPLKTSDPMPMTIAAMHPADRKTIEVEMPLYSESSFKSLGPEQ